MEAKANIQIGQVNNLEKQKVSLTYYIGSFDSVQEAQEAKYALDAVSKELGANVHDDAMIIGEADDKKAKKSAETVVEVVSKQT